MPSFSALCPTRRSNVFNWFFGFSSGGATKLTVEVSTTDDRSRNRIVNSSRYNLRPRRAAVNYKEAEEDSSDSEA